MNLVLGRKAKLQPDLCRQVWDQPERYVSRVEAQDLLQQAVDECRRVLRHARRPVYGWSGGKDSLALEIVLQWVDVDQAVVGMVRPLEFPAYLTWAEARMPPRAAIYSNDTLTLPWLAQHPRYLFPATTRLGYFWTLAGTRRAQHLHQTLYEPDLFILGRRRADNNWIAPAPFGIHTDKVGMRQYSPLRDWPHEAVLAVLKYAGIPLPPMYTWPEGWNTGTGPWPGRRPKQDGWANTWAIDPTVVEQAARHNLPGARNFLAGVAG